MKFLLFCAALILVTKASTNEDLWMKFKQEYAKTYKSLREDKLRLKIFQSTLQEIKTHNAKYENGEETWFMGINQFSDLTDDEFKAQYLTYQPVKVKSFSQATFNVSAPDSIDWRLKGAVLSVKNQGQCGSCWAFSAIGALEGQNAIKHGVKIDLSPQELVDCATFSKYQNRGCNGGYINNAFAYVRNHGISTLSSYPYIAHDEPCKSSTNSAKINVTGEISIPQSENQLKLALASVGPISVGIVGVKIKNYNGGIFNDPFCGYGLDHGVLAVGYGTENRQDFWIVKNSWGDGWGEKGYIRMTRNKDNQCGIGLQASYPVLV